MRNWNFCSAVITVNKKDGFYSTYEELKHTQHTPNSNHKPSFYSTYEELKRSCQASRCPGVPGFYSTYEELKLIKV